VPADWYILGYDMFIMHTFLRLSRTGDETDGYLSAYLDNHSRFPFSVDYRTEFPIGKGLWNYFFYKFQIFK